MSRTLAAELAAVNNGNYTVVFRLKAWGGRGISLQGQTTDILGFQISRTEIKVEVTPFFTANATFIQLLRGAVINGVEYTVGTSYYSVYKIEFYRDKKVLFASLIPRRYISIAGDDTYENVLTNFCTTLGMTAQFKNPTAPHWGYQLYPTGRSLTLNDARDIVSLLRQKYLITTSDQEGDVIQFSHYLNSANIDIDEPPILNNPPIKSVTDNQPKRFIWRDENNTVHFDGEPLTIPIHNLGYLESTDDPPITHLNAADVQYEGQVDLRIANDDMIYNSNDELELQSEVIETFQRTDTPTWKMLLGQTMPFSNTEGGALPGTIQAAAPYTPLNVSNFAGVLSANDNNMQAAMETIDDHHSALAPAINTPTATNDFLVGEQVATIWTWVRKTLAQTITILRTSLDAIYAPIAKGVTNGDSHDHTGGDGTTLKYYDVLLTSLVGATVPASTTYHTGPNKSAMNATTDNVPWPLAGTAFSLNVRLQTAQPASGSLVITLTIANVDTALVVTIPAGSAAGTYSDLTNTVAITAGSLLKWKVQNNATAASGGVAAITMAFVDAVKP